MLSAMILSLLLAAPADAPPTKPPAKPPHDPHVFRCVLDDNPRMLVISFGDDLWMSFDTTTCTVARVWKGDIDFTGTLYDHRHGPQPTSRGEDVPWHAEFDPAGIRVEVDGESIAPTPQWLGHAVLGGTVALHYRLDFGDAGSIDMTLVPGVAELDDGALAVVASIDAAPHVVRGSVRMSESNPTTAPSDEVTR